MRYRPATLDLSVVIPSMHEAENLKDLLPRLIEHLKTLRISWEVLVVDAGPAEETQAVTEGAGARYILEEQRGYGRALLRGISESEGEYVLTMDADQSHPVQFVRRLWNARLRGDIIIASRYVDGGHANQPRGRYWLSRILNWFFSFGLSLPVRDKTSGYRLYRKNLFAHIDPLHVNFVILMEILLKAYANGKTILEVPFYYHPRIEGQSNARVIQFGLDYLRLFKSMWSERNSIRFPDYDWRAHDSRIWFQRYWQRKRHEIILEYAAPFPSICDVGCGSSRILSDLPHAVGVDLRHDKLAFMRRTNDRLVQGDGMGLPFPDSSFACVISSQVLEHIPNEAGRHIEELLRVLQPGGTLVLGTPDYGTWQWPAIEWLYGKLAPGAYADEHVNPYTRAELETALTERGCVVEDSAYICNAELILKAKKGTANGS